MPKKTANEELYRAIGPFEWDGESYEEGDELIKPANWKVDEQYNSEFMPNGIAFRYDVETDYWDDVMEEDARGKRRKKKVKYIDTRRIILPVEGPIKPKEEEQAEET